MAQTLIVVSRRRLPLRPSRDQLLVKGRWSVEGGIDYFKSDADVNVSVVAQNFLMVKTAGRSFGRKKNYGLTVTVPSEPWCPVQRALQWYLAENWGIYMKFSKVYWFHVYVDMGYSNLSFRCGALFNASSIKNSDFLIFAFLCFNTNSTVGFIVLRSTSTRS